jgi:hypothetical protein
MNQHELLLWPLDSLHRVFLDSEPAPSVGWSLAVAGGEYQTFQLGLRYDGPLTELEAVPGPLRSGENELPGEAIQVRWVGLVPLPLDSSFDRAGAERPDLWPGWHPDPLLDEPPWVEAIAGRSTAFHFCLHVLKETPPGTYRGVVQVRAQGRVRARVLYSANTHRQARTTACTR